MFRRTQEENASKDGESTMNENTETVDIENEENTSNEGKKNLEIPQSARRPGMPGGFSQPNGLMGGFSQPTGNNTPGYGHNSQTDPNAKRLVISEGISISGEINDCDHLTVEGSVKADFTGSERIDVSETGLFKGSAETTDADIAGVFDGTLTVNGRLTVRSTGKIKGTVNYGELAVEAGAVIEGKINTTSEAADTKETTSKKSKGKNKDEENVAQMQLATGS